MTMANRILMVVAAVVLSGTVGWSQAVKNEDVLGTWQLTSYTAHTGKTSGQLMIMKDRFTLVYTMAGADGAAVSGRGHAGRYRIENGVMIFDIDWDVHFVQGKGTVAPKPYTANAKVTTGDDMLTLVFANGASQVYKRVGWRLLARPALSLGERDGATDRHFGERFPAAAGPRDVDAFDPGGAAKADVHPRIVV